MADHGGLLKHVMLCLFVVAFAAQGRGQNETELVEDSVLQMDAQEKLAFDVSFAFKTMNAFRGLLPSRAPTFSTQAGLKAGSFVLGFYGGASTNGVYSETDLILMYYRPRFNIRADWYYNFTDGITNIPVASGFLDLDPETTRGLLDFMIDVKVSQRFGIMSSTMLFGRDRPSLPADDAEGILLRRGEQRYSQFTRIQYTTHWQEAKVQVHAGYSFSWNDPSGPSFYGSKPGFNDIGASYTRKIIDTPTISLPFKATVSVNTVTNNVYLVGTFYIIELSKL